MEWQLLNSFHAGPETVSLYNPFYLCEESTAEFSRYKMVSKFPVRILSAQQEIIPHCAYVEVIMCIINIHVI